MSSKKNDNRKNIVVVGGGHAGVITARALSKALDSSKYNLILINPLPYRILLPATIRLAVSDRDNLQDRIFVPYDKLFYDGKGEFIQASVAAINAGENGGSLTLDSGEVVSYQYLVLAPGSTWPGPIAFPTDEKLVKEHIRQTRDQFANAKHVVIVGGGAVGIEAAGEIRDVWPDKKITLVHSGDQLLNATYPEKFRQKALASLQARNINVILGDAVGGVSSTQVVSGIKTRKGTSLSDADLVVACFGPRPNTGFISSSLGADSVTPTGCVYIRPTLQLKAHSNIFAAGDIIDWNEQKQAAKAGAHAPLIAKNVLALIQGKPLSTYKGSVEGIFITNGSNGGFGYVGILWGITVGNWIVKMVKSKGLMVSMLAALSGN